MKRRLVILFAIALLLAGRALALVGADDGFTGTVPMPGYVPELTAASFRRAAKGVGGTRDDGGDYEPLAILGVSRRGAFFVEDTVWTVNATGGSGDYHYRFYLVTLYDPDGDFVNSNYNPHGYANWSGNKTFSYRFVVPGQYYLLVSVEDQQYTNEAGKPLTVGGRISLTVNPDEAHTMTAAQKVEEIAGECLTAVGADAADYEKALWLHDWITHNAHYSQGQHYYSEDGVLIRGDGVCDSYCKAYRLLLNAVGIDCDRITNNSGSHAWNRAMLGDGWVQIDATWNDPGNSTSPESGEERHLYFGLTDALMRMDHAYTADANKPCNTLAQNYYVRQGLADQWLGELKCDALDALEENGTVYVGVSSGQTLAACDGLKKAKAYVPFAAMEWAMALDNPVDSVMLGTREWQVRYALELPAGNWPTLNAEASPAEDMPELVLPAAMTEIGEAAFAGNEGLEIAVLPEGVTAVGARAFADCANLRVVHLPESLSTDAIAVDAFEGSDRVVIYCPADSGAEAYAQDNGIPCRPAADDP